MKDSEKKFGHSIYYMNDQNIRDGLLAQKIKPIHLTRLLKGRGILVSPLASKEELIQILKFIRFDYHEYVYLSALLANLDKKESKSSIDIDKKVTLTDISSTFNAIKGILDEKQITAEVNIIGKKKVLIDYEYVEFDHSKPPMRQKSFKKGIVECDITDDGALLSYPANKVGSIIKEQLISQLSKKLDTELKPIEFDFEKNSIEKRNEFLTKIINSIPNYEVYDVVTVAVKTNDKDEITEDDSVDEAFTGEVRNAILRGRQILTSKIYSGLNAKNYYIYKITWKVRENVKAFGPDKSDCYTVEVEFNDKDKAKGLKYSVKSVQRYSAREKLNVTSENPMKSEQEMLGKLIYQTALSVYSTI
ncbi:hypothetical protein [Pantoea sp. DY-5]|uniref:hypothetical protein n=1 Tax=Pantoea sp. DY-5 TaxID=2871488 RepID=UPI001C989C24|nr:hypothetical protein [Pantoea sp. DY-5]MBY4839935.1 hypothetical protein [Pantoea sp. DY-5]